METNIEYLCEYTSHLDGKSRSDYITSLSAKMESEVHANRLFAWLYEQNVYGNSIHVLAYANGKTVARRTFWRNDVTESLVSYQPIDTYVSPTMRRLGIFSQMTRIAVEKAKGAYIYNYPNENSRPGYLKLGWTARSQERMDIYLGTAKCVWAALEKSLIIPKDVCKWRFGTSPFRKYFYSKQFGQIMVLVPKRVGLLALYLALGLAEEGGQEFLPQISPGILISYYGGKRMIRIKKNPAPVLENHMWQSFQGTIPCWKPDTV